MKRIEYNILAIVKPVDKFNEVHTWLINKVEDGIRQGWQPLGGISFSINKTSAGLSQAMIREIE